MRRKRSPVPLRLATMPIPERRLTRVTQVVVVVEVEQLQRRTYRRLRELGWTVRRLAAELGISHPSLLEALRSPSMSAAWLCRLEGALGVTRAFWAEQLPVRADPVEAALMRSKETRQRVKKVLAASRRRMS